MVSSKQSTVEPESKGENGFEQQNTVDIENPKVKMVSSKQSTVELESKGENGFQ